MPEKLDNVGQSDFALQLPKSPGTLLSWPEAVVPVTHTHIHREDGAVVPLSHTQTHTHIYTEDGAVVPVSHTHTQRMGLWSLSHTHTHTHTEDGAVVPVSHTHTHTRGMGLWSLPQSHTHTYKKDGASVPVTLTHTLTQREDGAVVPITRHRASHLPWLLKQGAARTSVLGSEHLPA